LSSADLQGIWTDSQIAPLKRIVDFVHALKGKIGIQLAHAGRKASTLPPWTERLARDDGWTGGSVTAEENGGWPNAGELMSTCHSIPSACVITNVPVYAPSAQSFHPGNYPNPVAADEQYIENLLKAFVGATER
jgi:2,4-dienoyl-CoA reductase-like NADH-dependent reductase (Old Yellow Enzyme family)